MKKKLISSLLAISMIITAVQPQITFAEEDIEITSEQETEDVMETETAEENSEEEITEATDTEDQSVGESIVEEQILDESETADPLQTYAEDNNEETQSDFLYTVLDDGTVEITGYQGDEKGDLIIPDSIDGHTVTSIGESAFYQRTFQGELILPDTVKVIKEWAFAWEGFSGNLTIPDSVTEIGAYAFYNSGFTGNLNVSDNVLKIGRWTFASCGFSGILDLPARLNRIENGVFSDCKFTGDLIIPENVMQIGNKAFDECKFDGVLQLPNSLTQIGNGAFDGCKFDGVLQLPNSLTQIGDEAFRGCKFSGNIVLPAGITYVGENSFQCAHINDVLGKFEVLGDRSAINNDVFGSGNSSDYYIECGTQMEIGKTRKAQVIINGMILDNSLVPKWRSSDDDIATIDTDGMIKAKEIGTVTIKAELFNGVSCETTITVKDTDSEYNEKNYVIYTSPQADKFDDLWVGDEIYIGLDYDKYKENDSLESVEVISGASIVTISPYWDHAWKIHCNASGTAVIKANFKNNICEPVEYRLNVKYRPDNVKIGVDKASLKLGGTITFNLSNLPYGTDPFLYVNDEDSKNFMINRLDSWGYGGPTHVFTRNIKVGYGVHYKMIYDTDKISYRLVLNITYPGYVKLAYYQDQEEAEKGYAMASESVKIEEPIIRQNMKSVYTQGEEQELQFYLDNTNYKDIYLEEGENKDHIEDGQYYYSLYYQPKLEIISGKDCVEFIGESKLTTLSLKQQIRFIKAGTVKFKISYEPSGINASVNKVYRPEKIVTVQVNPQNVTASFNSAGGSNIASQTIAVGSRIVEPKDPVRSGYTFLGWYVDGQKYDFAKGVEKDITLVAKWKKQITNVTGISVDKNVLKMKQGQVEQLKVTVTPKNASNKAVKWETSNTKVATVKNGKVTAKNFGKVVVTATALDGSGKKVSCNVTVGYAIDYKLNGGKNTKDNPAVYYNEVVKLKNPTRKGYNFVGWFADKKMKKQVKQITKKNKKDLSLYAKWEKIKVGSGKLTSATRTSASSMVIKYSSVSKAKGYEITYATDKKFKKNCKVVTTKAKSITLKKLQPKKTYYVKVRAYKLDSAGNKIYGKYSAVKIVKTVKSK